LLLTGDDIDMLAEIANAIADRLLNTHESSAYFPPEKHPDCYALRPAGKMRQIGADATREELIAKLQVTATVSAHKVGIIYECDRMNAASANIFLKTLEEPPRNSWLLLLTTRPYSLLPTIRSRCLCFRFPSAPAAYSPDGWKAWLADYKVWLEKLSAGIADKRGASDSIFGAYGLIARFGMILDFATEEVWKQQKEKLPPDLKEEEQVAIETGIANGLRARLFIEIEQATRDFAVPALLASDANSEQAGRSLAEAIERLEHAVGRLRLNLNESAALEDFLLASLRIWTRR
jgi:DNA polymerase-3 subunit delta'